MRVKVKVMGETVTSDVDGGTWESLFMLSDATYKARNDLDLPVTGGVGLDFWAGNQGGKTDGMLWDDIKITVHSVID